MDSFVRSLTRICIIMPLFCSSAVFAGSQFDSYKKVFTDAVLPHLEDIVTTTYHQGSCVAKNNPDSVENWKMSLVALETATGTDVFIELSKHSECPATTDQLRAYYQPLSVDGDSDWLKGSRSFFQAGNRDFQDYLAFLRISRAGQYVAYVIFSEQLDFVCLF